MPSEIHGEVSYPGIQFPIGFSGTFSHGIEPTVLRITCNPQSNPGLIAPFGDVVLFDGVQRIVIPSCKLMRITGTTDGSGQSWTVELVDRRWKWKLLGSIKGCYNQLDHHGKLIPWMISSPAELAFYCLRAMQESTAFIDMPPGLPRAIGKDISHFLTAGNQFPNTGSNPPINWEAETPAMALQALCDQFGRRVVYDLTDNNIKIVRPGFGKPLPPGPVFNYSPGLTIPSLPEGLICVGAPTRYQARMLLEPVGLDWNDEYSPIDKLTYAPVIPAEVQVEHWNIQLPTEPGPGITFNANILASGRNLAALGFAPPPLFDEDVNYSSNVDTLQAKDVCDILAQNINNNENLSTLILATSVLDQPTMSGGVEVWVTGASGGTFKLAVKGSSAVLAWNVSAAAMESALAALPSVGAGKVKVVGDAPYVVTFSPELNGPTITADPESLTGTLPDVTIVFPPEGKIATNAHVVLTGRDRFSDWATNITATAFAPPTPRYFSVEKKHIKNACPAERSWELCDPAGMSQVIRTAELLYEQARSLAMQSVWRCYRVVNTNIVTEAPASLLEIPGYGEIVNKYQVIISDTKVEQAVPTDIVKDAADFSGQPFVVDFYNAYSRDRKAQVIGSVFVGCTGKSWIGIQEANASTPESSPIYVNFSVDPIRQIITFEKPVYKLRGNRYVKPRLLLECAVEVRNAETNQIERMELARSMGGSDPSRYQVIRRDDVQLNVISTYNDDNTVSATTILEADPLFRANYYLDGVQAAYQMPASGGADYNGLIFIGLDGAIQQVQWEISESGTTTTISLNTEHNIFVPPYPVRRRAESLPPIWAEGGRRTNTFGQPQMGGVTFRQWMGGPG